MIHTIYCLIASILFWNSFLAAFMFAIIAPMLPTMEAKMSTPTRKSMVTKAYLGGARNSEHYEIILLQVVHRLRCLANCCQGQGGPIEAVDVLSDQSRIALNDVLQNFPLSSCTWYTQVSVLNPMAKLMAKKTQAFQWMRMRM